MNPQRFDACGGDPAGSWELEGLCYAGLRGIFFEEPASSPPYCEYVASGRLPSGVFPRMLLQAIDEWPMTAALVVEGARWRRSEAHAVIPVISKLSPKCFPDGCSSLSREFVNRLDRCAGTELCECRFYVPNAMPAIDAPLSVQGAPLSIDGRRFDFCADDERLRVLRELDGEQVVEVYRRK